VWGFAKLALSAIVIALLGLVIIKWWTKINTG
jgi:hypothetical protein